MADASKDKNDEDARYKNIPFPIIAKTYKANAGNLALTAEALGIDRSTLWQWRKQFPELEKMLNDYDESLGDLAGQEIKATVQGAIKGMSQEEAAEFIKQLEKEC